MNEVRKNVRQIGMSFIAFAGIVFVLSFIACILIQGGFLGHVPDIYGLIAYFGGPLPILPVALGSIGAVLLGISFLMK